MRVFRFLQILSNETTRVGLGPHFLDDSCFAGAIFSTVRTGTASHLVTVLVRAAVAATLGADQDIIFEDYGRVQVVDINFLCDSGGKKK